MTAALRIFEADLARSAEPHDVGLALNRLSDAVLGAKLFTLTAINIPAMHVRRVYSNNETAYPTGGTKPLVFDAWFEQMRTAREISVVNTAEEMVEDFPDLDLIVSLGCGAAINIPVMLGGELLGTINALDAEHFFTPDKVDAAQALIVPALACFLVLRARMEI